LPPHLAPCSVLPGRHLRRVGALLPSLPLPHCVSPPAAALPCTRSSPGRPPPPSGSCPVRCVSGRRGRACR
ncbi:unnamed protein product, partial [Closterium sp. NIES-53]